MPTITIDLDLSVVQDSNGIRRVVAQERGSPMPGGNIEAKSKDKIIWHHLGGTSHRFVVSFKKVPNNQSIWPFEGNADDTATQSMHVETAADRPSKFKSSRDVYYAVEVPADPTIVGLDPMIIIRRFRPESSALLGALVGAVIGAVITCIVLR